MCMSRILQKGRYIHPPSPWQNPGHTTEYVSSLIVILDYFVVDKFVKISLRIKLCPIFDQCKALLQNHTIKVFLILWRWRKLGQCYFHDVVLINGELWIFRTYLLKLIFLSYVILMQISGREGILDWKLY